MATISFIDPATLSVVSAFLFVFALVFGLLVYSKVLGFDRRVNAALALSIAFFAILYEPFVAAMAQYMPIAAAVLVVVFFIAFAKKVLAGKDASGDNFPMVVALGISLLLLGFFADGLVRFLPPGIDPTNVLWAAGIIIVVLFFWMIYKHK